MKKIILFALTALIMVGCTEKDSDGKNKRVRMGMGFKEKGIKERRINYGYE